MNGKGSDRRPALVSNAEVNARWAATFGTRVGDSRTAWWTLFIGACLALAFVLSSCSSAPRPKIGACDRPPMQHQGYDLAGCGVNVRDESQVWCLYVATVEGRRCRALIETHGCETWTLDESNTGCDGPSTRTRL